MHKDNYGVPIRPGDLIVYRAGDNLRIGRVNQRQATGDGKTYSSQILVEPLEKGAQVIWRRLSDVIRVHESTLTLAKLMGRKSFVEEAKSGEVVSAYHGDLSGCTWSTTHAW